jgi:hypothetical protein
MTTPIVRSTPAHRRYHRTGKKPQWGGVRRTTLVVRIRDARGTEIGTGLVIVTQNVDRACPFLVILCLNLSSRGRPSPEDLVEIEHIQTKLDELSEELDAYQPAIMMAHGRREWFFYTDDGARLAHRLLAEFAAFNISVETESDPKWSRFRYFVKMVKPWYRFW